VDYDQTYAGVAKGAAWKLLLVIAAILDLEIEQMDAVTAFLNGITKDTIYVKLPDGYKDGDLVCLLLRALYGLKQSPRLWQQTLRTELAKLGFYLLTSDNCIYSTKEGLKGIIILTYVDDFLLVRPDISEIQKLKVQLRNVFQMKDLGLCSYFLGVRIIRNHKERTIHLVQDNYIRKVVHAFGLQDAALVYTPMDARALDLMVPFDGEASLAEIKQYQSGIRSTMYLMTQT
jgi:hypothetical protein